MAKKSRELAKWAALSACRHKIVESQGRIRCGKIEVKCMTNERFGKPVPEEAAKQRDSPTDD